MSETEENLKRDNFKLVEMSILKLDYPFKNLSFLYKM